MLLTSITKSLINELSNNTNMINYLNTSDEVLNRWASRQCMPCNGSMINELITLARMIRG